MNVIARTERSQINRRRETAWSIRLLRSGAQGLRYIVVVMIGFVMLFPLYWMFITALRPLSEVYIYPPMWIPSAINLGNIPKAWTAPDANFNLFLFNTVLITILSVIGNLVSSAMVAFGFARLRSRYRDVLFMLVLATMMIPGQVTLIPTYALFTAVGWVNTFAPLIVPQFFGAAFYIFLLRQFIMTIPVELDDAAKIDGCTPLGIFFRMIVPLCKPAFAAVAIFSFQSHWNDFMGPLIYLSDPKLFTVALGIRLFVQKYTTDYQGMMVVSSLMILPMIVVFFLAQKHFIQGIALTGIKG